jgi:hypothetical protein
MWAPKTNNKMDQAQMPWKTSFVIESNDPVTQMPWNSMHTQMKEKSRNQWKNIKMSSKKENQHPKKNHSTTKNKIPSRKMSSKDYGLALATHMPTHQGVQPPKQQQKPQQLEQNQGQDNRFGIDPIWQSQIQDKQTSLDAWKSDNENAQTMMNPESWADDNLPKQGTNKLMKEELMVI